MAREAAGYPVDLQSSGVLRPLRADDLATLHGMWTEPEIRRFLFDDRGISLEETAGFIESSEANEGRPLLCYRASRSRGSRPRGG